MTLDAARTFAHGDALREAFALLGGVDVAILAVGVLGERGGLPDDIPAAVELLRVNTVGAASLLMETARLMRAEGSGTIVVLSSVAAERPRAANAVYCASKAGLDALAQALGDDLARDGRPGDGRAPWLRAHPHDGGPGRAAARDDGSGCRRGDAARPASRLAHGLGSVPSSLDDARDAPAAPPGVPENPGMSARPVAGSRSEGIDEQATARGAALARRRAAAARVRRRRLLVADLAIAATLALVGLILAPGLAVLALCALLVHRRVRGVACCRAPARPPATASGCALTGTLATLRWQALGSTVVLRVTHPADLEAAAAAVRAQLDRVEAACSRFREDSELSIANARAGYAAPASELLLDAVALALRAAELTGGLLDPCLGGDLERAGYDRDWELISAGDASSGSAPQVTARRRAAWQQLEHDRVGETVRVPAGAKLDLGATAKALAADLACAAAHRQGAGGVLVAIGGDIAVLGAAPPGGWEVHVTDDHRASPDAPGQRVTVASGGLATSSVAARRWRLHGAEMHHILDPATGRPRANALAHRDGRGGRLRRREHREHRGAAAGRRGARLAAGARPPRAARRSRRHGPRGRRLADRGGARGRGMSSPPLATGTAWWYLTRSTGAVALVLLTLTVVLGVIDVRRYATARWPRFVIDGLHRSVALTTVVFLVLHVLTSVLDGFAPIGLLDAVVPFAGAYRPFWLGLGAVSFDLIIAVTVTSLLRRRIGHGAWRAVHWLSYASWPMALLHGLGTGSDIESGWLLALSLACLAAVAASVLVRVLGPQGETPPRARGAALAATGAFALFLALWLPSGPLGSEWARRSGTPASLLHLCQERGATVSAPAPRLPRLLAGVAEGGRLDLEAHLQVHGPSPLDGGPAGAGLIEEVERAGLRGRGGAGYPTAVKMHAVAGARGRGRTVVVNAVEREPASSKDAALLELAPHLVLDGAALAARAVGARRAIVCVDDGGETAAAVDAAISERRGLKGDTSLSLAEIPGGFVSGQESALVSHLNGGAAKPTFTPPRVFERGVGGRPTLVDNAETLAHLALIARHGADWFRAVGTPGHPGSTLVTLAGPVAAPGVYEIEHGATLRSLLDAAGGELEAPRAILVGGYAGTWIDGREASGMTIDDGWLAAHSASTGAGVVAVLGERRCGVAETVRIARWLADESAGQCGPCVFGLGARRRAARRLGLGRRGGWRAGDPAARLGDPRPRRLPASGRDAALRRQRDAGVRRRVRRALPARAVRRVLATAGAAAAARRRPAGGAAVSGRHVRVDPIACEAHGMCGELLPEMVALDEWGYPIVDGRPLPAALVAHAERAVAACPTFALRIERAAQTAAPRTERPAAPAAGSVRNVRRRVPRRPDEPGP